MFQDYFERTIGPQLKAMGATFRSDAAAPKYVGRPEHSARFRALARPAEAGSVELKLSTAVGTRTAGLEFSASASFAF